MWYFDLTAEESKGVPEILFKDQGLDFETSQRFNVKLDSVKDMEARDLSKLFKTAEELIEPEESIITGNSN